MSNNCSTYLITRLGRSILQFWLTHDFRFLSTTTPLTLNFQAEEELYGAHAQPQKPLMKAGASVIESAESGIELSASAQSGTWLIN